MERPYFIASCSFGKDSLATILLAQAHGEPLDETVYCEVMFDEDISGEVPEHRDFIYETAIPALERMGVKVVVLRGQKTYVDLFTGRITRGPKKGMVRSFPICGKCAVQRDCKVRPIERYQKSELLKISGEIDAACREGSLSDAERRRLRADMADCGLELPPDPEPVKTPRKKAKGRER